MKIIFLGVGEACDPLYHNTSILLHTEASSIKQTILLDCGFTAPHHYFASCADPEQLDILWISHFHGDHFFGVPLLLLRFLEMGRVKPLLIAGQQSIEKNIRQVMQLAYPGLETRLSYQLQFINAEANQPATVAGLSWQTAVTDHPEHCLALRIDVNGKSIFYSGDGRPTTATLTLAHGCNLIIHEAFQIENQTSGHGSVQGSLDFCRQAKADALALLHVQRETRQHHKNKITQLLKKTSDLNAFLPEPGDIFTI